MRLVLDTPVIVAALRIPDGASRLCLESVVEQRHTLLLSVPLAIEYEAVLKRPDQLKATALSADDVERLIDGQCDACEEGDLLSLWRPIVADPDDEMVVETAFVGRADALLTFNVRDFATAAKSVGIPVFRPGEACARQRKR